MLSAKHIITETVHKIACTVCREAEAHKFDMSKAEALIRMQADGWRAEGAEICCPSCAEDKGLL